MFRNIQNIKIQKNKILLQLPERKNIKLILKDFDIPVISVLCEDEVQSFVLSQVQELTIAQIVVEDDIFEVPLSSEIRNRVASAMKRLDTMGPKELLTRASWIHSQVKHNQTLKSGCSQFISAVS